MPMNWGSPEISASFCFLGSWRCTSGDAAGQLGCLVFIIVGCVASLINALKNRSGARVDSSGSAQHANSAMKYLLWILICVSMYLGSVNQFTMSYKFTHPIQCDVAQWVGAVMLVIAGVGWAWVHWDLGRNWSPVPQMLQDHELVTRGVFKLARHPMYAVFTWSTFAIGLATFDWVRVLSWIVMVVIVTARIPQEEGILVEKFGEQYLEYRKNVGALGPFCCCFWYNRPRLVEATPPVRNDP